MTFEQATAALNAMDPKATVVAKINGRFYTLPRSVMKGFLMPTDEIEYLKEW